MLAVAGCGDFLDVEPQDEISREEALNDLVSVQTAMIGAYSGLTADGYYKQQMVMYPEMAGNLAPSPNATSADITGTGVPPNVTKYRDAYTFTIQPTYTENALEQFYASIYVLLRRANDLIEAIPQLTEGTEAQRNSLLGEAFMLRAVGHFDLVRLYGQAYGFSPNAGHPGVVIADRPLSVFDFPRRATVAEVYELIISDLQQAAALIGPVAQRTTEPIWLSAPAARALLARAFAYTGNWEGVLEAAGAVIGNGRFTLTARADYQDGWENGRLSEIIFEIDLQRLVRPEGSGIITSVSEVVGAANTEPLCSVTEDLSGLFEETDIRRQLLLENGEGDLLSLKYPFAANAVRNIPLLRLSEMYLLRAEAYAELGRDEEARADYDLIHQRAVEGAQPTTLSGAELLAEIRRERRRELHLEGHLLFDLSRWGEDVVRADCLSFNPNCDLNYPDYRYVLPIPLEAIEANPNLEQNDGY